MMRRLGLIALCLGALIFGALTLYLIVASIQARTLFAALPIGCVLALTCACLAQIRHMLRNPPGG